MYLHSSLYILAQFVFFFTGTSTTEIYTLSLHDALPILVVEASQRGGARSEPTSGRVAGDSDCTRRLRVRRRTDMAGQRDRKSTRLNSSHSSISYAVFCLKKKNVLPFIPNLLHL